MPALLTWCLAFWQARVQPKLRHDEGATTLEYVIIAAIVCAAAVVVTGLIVAAINNYGSQIPNG
jgi:Flp pilus assembly pilin Flp